MAWMVLKGEADGDGDTDGRRGLLRDYLPHCYERVCDQYAPNECEMATHYEPLFPWYAGPAFEKYSKPYEAMSR